MKNFPKKVDSKTRYLRIEIPENLDLVLEGLIRKVLREQPDMENIYSFAAEYFETLIRIREQAGVKHSSSQIFPSSSDEEALQMIKLANTFQKPVHEKLFSLKNSTESQKLEKREQKIIKTLPNAKESSDPKSSNHKLKISNKSADLTTSNKVSKNDNESISKLESESSTLESKKSNASDYKALKKNQDNEAVVKNKEHVRKNDEEKIEKVQEEPVLKSSEINENVKAKANNQVLNGVRETCQVNQEINANSFLEIAKEKNLKEKTENVIRNKNTESQEYENEKKTSVYENIENEISSLEKNSDVEKKKKDKNEGLQLDEQISKANEENKQDKEGFLTENEDVREKHEKEAKTANEETSIKNNNNEEEKKEEIVNPGKSVENKNSEEIKMEEEKEVEKNDELNENKSTALSTSLHEENKTENKSVEQTLKSKNAGQILNLELVSSSPSESVFSKEKEDKHEKSEGESVNVTEDVNCFDSENKLKVPDSLINEMKEDLLLKNNEVISNLTEEEYGFSLNKLQSEETEINKEELALEKSEEKDQTLSWSEKEEEGNIKSEVMKGKEIDKNFDFLNVSNTEMVERKSETDVKLCLKSEEEETRESDSLNLKDEMNESIKNNLEKNDEELTVVKKVGNEADKDIQNRVLAAEDINKTTDDVNDSYVNKKSFFKTPTESIKELDDEKLQVSDHSKEEVFSTAAKEQKSKKEADIEIYNNFNESEKYNSDKTNEIIKLENEKEKKPSEENLNQENDGKNIKKNNDQKEEKEDESFIHPDPPLNQKTEELGKIEKNDDEEKELCTVADAFVLNTLKPKEDKEKKEWNNEENNKEAKSLVERKIKTIETHYYDLLKVPEIVKKEYRVHHTEEKLPQTPTNENERNSEFVEEEKVKNGTTSEVVAEEKPKDSQPNAENKFFLSDSALNLEEVPLGDPLKANEIFLKREKHYSSMEKIIAKATAEESKEGKAVVTEIMEKRSIFEAGAVPLEPRDEEKLKNQNLQTSESAKEEKHDKYKSSTEELESNNYESNASISAESLDTDVAIISVDVNTVAEEQVKKKGDREEEKVPVEISGSATDNSAPRSTPKKLLRGEEIERDYTETNDRREKKKLSRSCSQTLMKSEGLKEKNDLRKRNSMAAIGQESRDEDIWSTIEKELQMAAIKIQSKFRGYSTRKKLRREDAVQITTEEPSGSETLVEEAEDGGCQSTGEFHDSIVLSVHPR